MKHLKGFNLYNEGLFDYIRSKRFKDDDIVQNLIKIFNKANPKDIEISLIADEQDNDDIYYQSSIITYSVLINNDVKFEITNKTTETLHGIDGFETKINYQITIDNLTLDSGSDISNTNIKKLFNKIDKIYNKGTTQQIDDDSEIMKSTLKKELKFKAKR
jgi:hypothetical protein